MEDPVPIHMGIELHFHIYNFFFVYFLLPAFFFFFTRLCFCIVFFFGFMCFFFLCAFCAFIEVFLYFLDLFFLVYFLRVDPPTVGVATGVALGVECEITRRKGAVCQAGRKLKRARSIPGLDMVDMVAGRPRLEASP